MYDIDGIETDDADLAVDREYTIELLKRIEGQTFSSITA